MNLDHNYPKRRIPQHEHNYAKSVDMDIPNLTDDEDDDECAAMKVSESVNRDGAYGGDSNNVEGRASPEGGGGEDGNPDDEGGGDRSGGGGEDEHGVAIKNGEEEIIDLCSDNEGVELSAGSGGGEDGNPDGEGGGDRPGGGGKGEKEVAIKNGEEDIIDLCSVEFDGDSEVVVDVDVIVQYPTNSPGRIAVKKVDVETLNPGRFLNDIIIDFYMKYLYHEHLDPSYQPNIHIFTSQFYKGLTTNPPVDSMVDRQERASNMTMAQKRHGRVARWLRKAKFLEKSIAVIPVCENSNWYIVVVIMPGGDEPCLLVLDSLGGTNDEAVDILKECIKTERDTNLQHAHNNNIKIIIPKTPRQPNGWDCGIYLLHYAEKIMNSPHQFETLGPNILSLENWFPEAEVLNKRKHISDIISQLALIQRAALRQRNFEQEENRGSSGSISSASEHVGSASMQVNSRFDQFVGAEQGLIGSRQTEQVTMSAEQFIITGEQFNISAEQINMDVDQFNMDTEHYSSGSSREQVSSGSIEQFSSSEQFISGSEQVSSGREQFNSGSEQASSGREQVSSGSEQVSSGREQVSSGREKVSSDSGSGQEQLSNGTFSCEVCLVVMTNLRSLTKHICPIKIIKDRSAHLRVLDNASNTSMAQIRLNCNTPRQISSIVKAQF